MNHRKIIVFAPHPDDETLGCGGTIAKKLYEGYEPIVVVLTDGRHALSKNFGIESNPTPEEMKKIREREVKRSTKILGVLEKNLLLLEFEDGTLAENEEKVEETITQILNKNSPVEIYFPYEKESHPDHLATNRAVINSVRKLKIPIKTYQYAVYPKHFYIDPIIDKLLNIFKHNIVYVDVSQFFHLKKKAIMEMKSQIEIVDSKKQRKPVIPNIESFLKKREKFYVSN